MANQFPKAVRSVCVLVFCLLAVTSEVRPQATADKVALTSLRPSQATSRGPYELEKGMNEYGLWAGASFDSPTVIGTAEDRKFFTLGLRYGRILGGTERVAYEYTLDAVPVALVFQPDFARAINRNPNHSIYGAGISPVGFKVIFNRQGRVKPFASTAGGFLYFRRPVPVDIPLATKFNFTFEFDGGVQIFSRSRRAIALGYKFQHISNAGRSKVNPGLDVNVFYVGFSLFK